MYDNRPKMKRDAWAKVVFFLSKNTTFTQASLFIFGLSSYVTALDAIKLLKDLILFSHNSPCQLQINSFERVEKRIFSNSCLILICMSCVQRIQGILEVPSSLQTYKVKVQWNYNKTWSEAEVNLRWDLVAVD